MKPLQTPLIANRATKQLSALGFKQLYRVIDKACRANNIHRLKPEGRVLSEEQLSQLQKQIKVVNNQLQLPSIATF